MLTFHRARALRARLPVALALGALAFVSAGAQAADYDEITISAPTVTIVGHDDATRAPIEEYSKKASVKLDPVTLTTNSGVALVKDSVLDAALEACSSISLPLSEDDDGTCVRDAVKSAQPQIDAAVARARSTANG
jgi:UrcA family protein